MSDEERIDRILGDWRERLDNGETVAPEDVIREHPDLEGPLRTRFHALALFQAAIAPAEEPPHPLRDLAEDRYLDFEPCGEGGMGIVYWALDQDLNREVAFKIVRPDRHNKDDVKTPPEPLGPCPPGAAACAARCS